MKGQASDSVASIPIKEKVMPIALKANVTRAQTSNDSVCQDGSDENEDEDKEEEFNSRVRTIWMLFKKGNRFNRENRLSNGGDRFDRGHGNRSKGVGPSRGKHNCYGCGSKNHFVDNCPKGR
ncbi:UBN2 domain-containing protein [Tanacetum coccineum]